MVLATVAVIGSAGIAWAVGAGPQVRPRPSATATDSSALPTAVGNAPTPVVVSTTARPVVQVVPGTTPSGTSVGPTAATSTTSAPAQSPQPAEQSPQPAQSPRPTRSNPGKGVGPKPRPTKSHK